MIVDVLLPCHPQKKIPFEVIDSILTQDYPVNLMISNAIDSGHQKAREHVKNLYKVQNQFIVSTDDAVIIPPNTFKKQIEFLQTHLDFAAIGIYQNPRPGNIDERPFGPENEAVQYRHVSSSLLMWRSIIFNNCSYLVGEGCDCQRMCDQIRDLGWKIGYLNNIFHNHIDDSYIRR